MEQYIKKNDYFKFFILYKTEVKKPELKVLVFTILNV